MNENALPEIVIASDHAGFDLKKELIEHLISRGYRVNDVGTDSSERTDYPVHAHRAAVAVLEGNARFGVLICGSGNGVNMSANKHKGIRSALAWNETIAELARKHNDANMLAIPARFMEPDVAKGVVDAFLGAEFEGGRHEVRVKKIDPVQQESTS